MAGTITGSRVLHRGRGIVKNKVNFTVDGSGDASVVNVGPLFGKLVAVDYDAGDLDTGVVITVKDKATGATVFSLSSAGTTDRHIRPTGVITDNVGVAVTALAASPNVNRDIYLSGLLTIVVSAGGSGGESGGLNFTVQEGLPATQQDQGLAQSYAI